MGTVYFWEISQMVMQILWLGCYWYYISQAGTMEKGAGKQAAGMILTFSVLALWVWIPLWGAWLLVTGILLLYDLFFDGEPFGRQWWGILLPGLCLCGSALLPVETIFVSSGVILFVFLALLGSRRGSLRVGNGILTALKVPCTLTNKVLPTRQSSLGRNCWSTITGRSGRSIWTCGAGAMITTTICR